MTGLATPAPSSPALSFTRPREILPAVRHGVLAALLVAFAVSISASQILLAALFLLTIPWAGARASFGPWLRTVGDQARTALRRHPLTPPVAILTGLTLLSALLSGDAGWSLYTARDTLQVATFYLVLQHTRNSTHALRLWQGFLLTLTLMACYGLGQAYLCGPWRDAGARLDLTLLCTHAWRIRGPFSIYMTFGGVLLLGTLFFLAYLANAPWRRSWWMVPAGALTLTALALTYSRNAWLGLAAGALGLIVTARRAARVVLLLALIAALVAAVSPGAVMDRVRSMANPQDATIRDRVAMWRSGLAMIADHPVLGVGPGEVRVWYQHYRRPEAVRLSTGHLHNSPIQIAAERGLPALGVWLWLWVIFFREGIGVLRRLDRDHPQERALVSASLAGVAGFLVAGLFEHNFGDAEVVMVVYALMALPFIVLRDLPSGTASPTRPAVRAA